MGKAPTKIQIEKVKKSLRMRLVFTLVFGAIFAFSMLTLKDAYDIAVSGEVIVISGILFVLLLASSIERFVRMIIITRYENRD